LELRPATPEDAEAILATFFAGLDGYREFAPPGWAPPPGAAGLDHVRERLAAADYWCVCAVAGEAAGHAAFQPSLASKWPDPAPELAHLAQLFVRRPWWGSGLAAQLHTLAVEEAAARGFREMRLYAAAGHARARRFYEREGWAPFAEPFDDPRMGLALVEYRRAL